MEDESAIGPAGAPDRGGHSQRSRSEPAPLQSRAKFLQNWNWASVTQINGGLCERGRAQRGVNSETHATFAEIGRALAIALFSSLPFQRRKEASSAAAHFITGVLDEEMMVAIIGSLSETADWKAGDRVKTLRGSLRGTIVRALKDGRVVWNPDGAKSELTALPESLARDDQKIANRK